MRSQKLLQKSNLLEEVDCKIFYSIEREKGRGGRDKSEPSATSFTPGLRPFHLVTFTFLSNYFYCKILPHLLFS